MKFFADGTCRQVLFLASILGFTLLVAAVTQHHVHPGPKMLSAHGLDAYGILQHVANETEFHPSTAFETENEGLAFLFVQFMRVMHSKDALPYQANGDLWGARRGELARVAIRQFLDKGADLVIGESNRCLEWGRMYLEQEPFASSCKEKWSFEYSQTPRVDHASMTVYGDLDALPVELLTSIANFFDIIVCTQVFEHVGQPFESAKAIYKMTSNNGICFFTVPFLSRYHIGHISEDPSSPLDHFRYTLAGSRHLLRDIAGFALVQEYLAGGSLLTTAHLLGFGMQDFSEQELQELLYKPTEYKIGSQNDLYFNVFLSCQKNAQ